MAGEREREMASKAAIALTIFCPPFQQQQAAYPALMVSVIHKYLCVILLLMDFVHTSGLEVLVHVAWHFSCPSAMYMYFTIVSLEITVIHLLISAFVCGFFLL